MKLTLHLLFFIIHLHSYSQQKDRRKYIGKEIIFSSFKVSSSDEIWVPNHKNELFFFRKSNDTFKRVGRLNPNASTQQMAIATLKYVYEKGFYTAHKEGVGNKIKFLEQK